VFIFFSYLSIYIVGAFHTLAICAFDGGLSNSEAGLHYFSILTSTIKPISDIFLESRKIPEKYLDISLSKNVRMSVKQAQTLINTMFSTVTMFSIVNETHSADKFRSAGKIMQNAAENVSKRTPAF
jgi:hypothetical protein